jgi:Uma2 family endonuclease
MTPPPRPYHGRVQVRLCDKLAKLGGERTVEAAIATPLGLFVADVAWCSQISPPRSERDPALIRAPELCIEVVSPSNSRKEMNEKVAAYLAAGAEEVWIVYPRSKRVEVHGRQGIQERSRFPVDFIDLFE